jgi:hypothetical protein
VGSFVDSRVQLGFVRGFVRGQKREKCRFMRHKQR